MDQTFRNYFNAGLDQRDQDQIDEHIASQGEKYAAYLRAADEHGIDPEPVPHIHNEHEEKARRCAVATWSAHAVGALVGLGWTFVGTDHSTIAAVAAVFFYMTLAAVLDVSFEALAPRASFCKKFHLWYFPMVPVCLISAAILLSERFADPDFATFLLKLDSAAWLGLESSMLILGAVTMVGRRRFDWSGSLTREYRALENAIAELKRKIDARQRVLSPSTKEKTVQPGKSFEPPKLAGLAIAAILLGWGPMTAKACPAVLSDQTGSVASAEVEDERLSQALATGMAMMSGKPCLTITPFSANPFSAAGNEITFTAYKPTIFTPMRKAIGVKMQAEALAKIRSSLSPRLPIASCTNISDVLFVAARWTENTLVYTDGLHDCAAPPSHGITSNHPVVVVLTRSRYDSGSNAETFSKRRKEILKMMPNAVILPEFELDRAVRILLQIDPTAALVKAAF